MTLPRSMYYVKKHALVDHVEVRNSFKRLKVLRGDRWVLRDLGGLENNKTQLLAALFTYQTLVRYNHRQGNENGQVQWILDML